MWTKNEEQQKKQLFSNFFLSQFAEASLEVSFNGVWHVSWRENRKISMAKNKRESGKNLTSELEGHFYQRPLRRARFCILFLNFFIQRPTDLRPVLLPELLHDSAKSLRIELRSAQHQFLFHQNDCLGNRILAEKVKKQTMNRSCAPNNNSVFSACHPTMKGFLHGKRLS